MTGNSLVTELENCRRQFDRIVDDARHISEGLSDFHFNWRPQPAQWSIAQCLDHLTITALQFVPHLEGAIQKGRAEGLYADGPFRYGRLESWLARWLEPPVRLRLPGPRKFAPPDQPGDQVLQSFVQSHGQVTACIDEANGLDLVRLRVESPLNRWVSYSLGKAFDIIAAHDRRHLWQARQVLAMPEFPLARRERS